MNKDQIVGLIGLVSGVLLYSLAGDSEAYLFPRIIAIVMAIIGLAILGSNVRKRHRSIPVSEQSRTAWFRIIPVIVLFLVYPWAMEAIGFYATGFAVFLAIVWIYAPEPDTIGIAVRRIAITFVFIITVFAIFSLLLDVQTPRGMLF